MKRHSLEHPLQQQIADALRLEIASPGKGSRDGVVWWSVDHAAYAGSAPGARVARGMVTSVPDLFVLHRGIAHMVEIKTPAGELSDPQQSVMAAVLASGGWVGVVRACIASAINGPRLSKEEGLPAGPVWEDVQRHIRHAQ